MALPPPPQMPPELERPALAPVERMGRFDGQGFEQVQRGSIPPSHVYVLVHGWEPDWGELANAHPRLRSWQMRLEGDEPFESWIPTLGAAIQSADPHAVVLAYSWFDDAATGPHVLSQRRAFAYTKPHGQWLARAVADATRDDFFASWGRVHIIGHSYGARVAALAALYMDERPHQLTFFDAPDSTITHFTGSQMMLAEILRKLPIGNGPGRIYVENYVSSIMGVGYHYERGLSAVVDVVLAPPHGVFDLENLHTYPMRFYTATAGLDVGLGWSPLITQRWPEPGCYQQLHGQLALVRGCTGRP